MSVAGIIVVAALCITASVADIATEDGVFVLTKDNYDDFVKNSYVLVEFYAPWCGHCKALAPEFVKAAAALSEINSEIKLAKVDATKEMELAEKHGIRGYPTLKFYKKGPFIDYTGERTGEGIVKWVLKKSGPPAKDVTSVDEAKTLIDENNIVVMGFFKDQESDNAKVFMEVANSIDDHVFGITNVGDVFSEYKVDGDKIVLFKKIDGGDVIPYEGQWDAKELKEFITVNALPLIVDFNQETAPKIFSGDVKSHLLLFLSKEAKHYDKYVEGIKEPAEKHRGKILFVTINTDEDDHARILEFFGMKKEDIPAMRIIQLEQDMAKYKPQNPDLDGNNVMEFVTAFTEGKLQRHLLTQDLPDDWDKNPVKMLVGTNFHEVVFDTTKNVLVEFYAPWCGHCKQLAPIYDKLGEKYKDDNNVVIAKMDATANELDEIKVNNFPTIILFKKDTNERVEYNGERNIEGLSKFIDTDGVYGQAPEEAQEEDEDDDTPRKDEL